MPPMNWELLLSPLRQGKHRTETQTVGRSVFQQDFDRIVYCSAFRRMQDKAQVFPLAKSDFVRTRLTHSLEVSCVGRSLGTELGQRLREHKEISPETSPGDIGNIVAAACLAHDIGNPPFGHTGESAIAEWFVSTPDGQAVLEQLTPEERTDFEKFEGNAQGFRVLTKLQNSHNPGLQLTCAVLGAFTKYPRPSYCNSAEQSKWKKHGFFRAEADAFQEVALALGIKRYRDVWSRHPLAYLVEAADDICYRVNDLEDGFRLKHIALSEAQGLLLAIFGGGNVPSKLHEIGNDHDKVGYLRARAINHLVDQCVTYFMHQREKILCGELEDSIVGRIPSSAALSKIIEVSKTKIYRAQEVLEIEVPGFQVLGGLLQAFMSAVNDVAMKGEKRASARSSTVFYLLPGQFRPADGELTDPYVRTLKITDFISGMTDSFAVALYKQITGISLPIG
jgi:dGTPase